MKVWRGALVVLVWLPGCLFYGEDSGSLIGAPEDMATRPDQRDLSEMSGAPDTSDATEDMPEDSGDMPDAVSDVCALDACSGNGTCVRQSGRDVCDCEREYQGEDCSACAAGHQDNDGDGVCRPDCETAGLNAPNACPAPFACSDASGQATCSGCQPGFQDNDDDGTCEPDCEAAALDCSGQGTCQDSSGQARCVCAQGYDGDACAMCATGYQDNDGDGVCEPDCATAGLMCAPHQACVDDSGQASCADFPATCAQTLRADPAATADGFRTLYLGNDPTKPWLVRCEGLTGMPRAYLPLARTTSEANVFRRYVVPAPRPAPVTPPLLDLEGRVLDATTRYSMVRINEMTLRVEISDVTHARSVYGTQYTAEQRPVHFGTATGCMLGEPDASKRRPGRGAIDLTGTPFEVAPTQEFRQHGECASGGMAVRMGQRVELSGVQGSCGTIAPKAVADHFGDTCAVGGRPPRPMVPLAFPLQLAYTAPVAPWEARPQTCAEHKAFTGSTTDGDVTLYIDHDVSKPWTAFCADMATADPKAYLTLPEQSGTSNLFTSQNGVPSQSFERSVEARYQRVRVDPRTLRVNVNDARFSTQMSFVTPALVGSFGVVGSCSWSRFGGQYPGVGYIDLRGTPFEILSEFGSWGFCSSGGTMFSFGRQHLRFEGDGQCGAGGPKILSDYHGDGCVNRPGRYISDLDWVLELGLKP